MMRRNNGTRVGLGVGKRAGPRTEKFKPSKDELYRVICACKTLGFGNDYISHWTGYSSSMVALYCVDFNIPAVVVADRPARMFDLLPAELQREMTVIKTKSAVAHTRVKNKIAGIRAVATHELLDEDEETCCNVVAQSRPEEALP